MTEQQEEQAALYVLGQLEARELAAFERDCAGDTGLRELVRDWEETTRLLAFAVPAIAPSPDLCGKIQQAVQREITAKTEPAERKKIVPFPAWLPWAIAASFLLCSVLLWQERQELRDRITHLQAQNNLSRVKIARLTSLVKEQPQASAVCLWDAEKATGLLVVDSLSVPARNQDYQLWVIDAVPVSAGVFTILADGTARVEFKPNFRVSQANKFAVSLEPKGGRPSPTGPIVLISQ